MTEAKNLIIDIGTNGEMTASLDPSSRWGESDVDPLRDIKEMVDRYYSDTGSKISPDPVAVIVTGQTNGQIAAQMALALMRKMPGDDLRPLVDEVFLTDFGPTEQRMLDLYGLQDIRHMPIDNLYKSGSARQQGKHDALETLFARYGDGRLPRARAERYEETRNRFHQPVAAPKNIEDFITERRLTKRQRRRQKGKSK
jgi:hypothetical protein